MKKLIILLTTSLLYACGSSDSSGTSPNFEITITANSNVVIDEQLIITVSSNEPITSLELSTDNFITLYSQQTSFGMSAILNFSFDTLGNKTISVRAKNANNDVSTKSLTVNVLRGGAVKINTVQVVSFHNINQTWDPEFSDTDPNRLADVKFVLLKPKINVFNDNGSVINWFQSAIKLNQGDLTWDVSSDNLYLNPNLPLRFALGDDDGGGVGQDLMLGPPFDREISFSQYIATQPSSITFSVPEIDLEVLLSLDWGN